MKKNLLKILIFIFIFFLLINYASASDANMISQQNIGNDMNINAQTSIHHSNETSYSERHDSYGPQIKEKVSSQETDIDVEKINDNYSSQETSINE